MEVPTAPAPPTSENPRASPLTVGHARPLILPSELPGDEGLRYAHALLVAAVEAAGDAVFVKDLQGHYLMINSAGARMVGRRVEEVIGRDDREIYSPETAERMIERDREIMRSGRVWTYEDQGQVGETLHTYFSTKGPLLNASGEVVGLFGITREITGQRALEADHVRVVDELCRRVNELSLLNELAVASTTFGPAALLASGLPRVMVTLSADVGRALLVEGSGWRTVDAIGTDGAQAPLGVPRPADWGPEVPEVLTESGRWLGPVPVASAVVVPMRGQTGLLGALVLGRSQGATFGTRDCELLQAVGAQLGVAVENAKLFADLKQSYSDLARAQAQLVEKERLAALGELAAVVAHEIRNPLGAIVNAVSAMRRLQPLGAPSPLVDVVAEEAERLERIVADMLDFARPTDPALRMEKLEPIIREAVGAALPDPIAKRIAVSVAIDAGLEPAPMDRRMLRQALLNLVQNAVQAMPSGGALSIRAGRTADQEPELYVTVEDTGVGMSPEVRARVFEPFFTTKATGTGLGMALVRRIVDGHRGKVEVDSSPGCGTRLTLKFPLRERG